MENILVVLDKNDMVVTKDGQTLKIKRSDAPAQTVPFRFIGQVMVHGNPMVSCGVWAALAEWGIPAVIFSNRGSSAPAWLGSGLTTSTMARISQHNAAQNPAVRARVGGWLIHKKISGHLAVLAVIREMISDNKKERWPLLSDSPLSPKKIVAGVARAEKIMRLCLDGMASASDTESLMGHEGVAAAAWFDFLRGTLPKKWLFSGRNRRPPKDPVNALLSLTYTIAMSEMRRAVHQRGLDPCIGFLHSPAPGREAMTIDMLELLRPGSDAFVLGLLGENGLTPDHFSVTDKNGCRLNKEGRGIYYEAWAERRNSWPLWTLKSDAECLDGNDFEDGNGSGFDDDSDDDSEDDFGDDFDDDSGNTFKPLSNCCRWAVWQSVLLWDEAV